MSNVARTSQPSSADTAQIPELEPHCGSWVITSPAGDVSERYERETVERAAKAGYRVETAAGYLARINREIEEKNAEHAARNRDMDRW